MNRCLRIGLLLLGFLCLFSCGHRSLQDFHEESESIIQEIVEELRLINTREELMSTCSKFKYLFERLVNVMISAREFKEKHPSAESAPLTKRSHELSEEFRLELNRVYRIDGTKEILEKCQEGALNRLDGFEKRLLRTKH